MIDTPVLVSFSTPIVPHDSMPVECRGFVYQDEDGRYCAYATRLPGAYGEGETEAEAFADLCDAFAFALETYIEKGEAIPWRESLKRSDLTGIELWAVVHVKQTAVS